MLLAATLLTCAALGISVISVITQDGDGYALCAMFFCLLAWMFETVAS